MRVINTGGDPLKGIEALSLHRTSDVADKLMPEVSRIVNRVRREGDNALAEYTRLFDGVVLKKDSLKVNRKTIEAAYGRVGDDFLKALRKVKDNIYRFHRKQIQRSWFDKREGALSGQRISPLDSVGIYVPGGSARYPSSVLMSCIPAKVANVKRIVMITPPGVSGISPEVLVAASEAGIDEIYGIGGAQGIAALAYGTASVPAVDKIVGPGNIYVTLAKKLVFGDVGIDMVAGPSEVLIIADEGANPVFVAADMIAQAEHDAMASCILITDSEKLLGAVKNEIKDQLSGLPKKETAQRALENCGALILVKCIQEACDISNIIAPEHLGVMVRRPMKLLSLIKNAGSVFLGDYSPEALGDYYAGANHVLPTGGTARFLSPLGVEQFIKKTNILYYSAAALSRAAEYITVIAEAEGLNGHARAVNMRCSYEKSNCKKGN